FCFDAFSSPVSTSLENALAAERTLAVAEEIERLRRSRIGTAARIRRAPQSLHGRGDRLRLVARLIERAEAGVGRRGVAGRGRLGRRGRRRSRDVRNSRQKARLAKQ